MHIIAQQKHNYLNYIYNLYFLLKIPGNLMIIFDSSIHDISYSNITSTTIPDYLFTNGMVVTIHDVHTPYINDIYINNFHHDKTYIMKEGKNLQKYEIVKKLTSSDKEVQFIAFKFWDEINFIPFYYSGNRKKLINS